MEIEKQLESENLQLVWDDPEIKRMNLEAPRKTDDQMYDASYCKNLFIILSHSV